jgi:hypothetical protein
MNLKLPTMIATGIDTAKATPQGDVFIWLVIIAVVAVLAHAIYRFINRP